jgi:RNA polymerase sigma-70 factor (ECF subfamily)
MAERERLAETFEQHRAHLRSVAYRMLGSTTEAEDAVQETWLRLTRADTDDVGNLGAWLRTVVARVCLDMLRTRRARGEASLEEPSPGIDAAAGPWRARDPEEETVMAESVGLALLVVLETLSPAERLAFVLHDMFAVPFDEIAAIVGRTPTAARQLASRARRRVQGRSAVPASELREQRQVVEAFLAALRAGDFEGLIAVLDPDVEALAGGRTGRGAREWAAGAVTYARLARGVQPALINGTVGLVLAPRGRLVRALNFTIQGGKVRRVEVITDPEVLRTLDLAVLED